VTTSPGLTAPVRVDEASRLAFWRARGATIEEALELRAYAASPVQAEDRPPPCDPWPEAPSVSAWERYAEDARREGALPPLRRALIQLQFPIRAGLHETPEYRAATRRGQRPEDEASALQFQHPEGLRIFLRSTPAGRVPVILAEAREDFEALVQAVTRRNEPDAIPASMGACLVAGYNNWDRIAERRRRFETEHPEDWTGAGWEAAFRELVPQKELYQDRFMILSSGPYSATPAGALGLSETAWTAASVQLRLEHECTHYFMREAFGAMRKSVLDELVADYMGLVEALGAFRLDAFVRFMGLESHPHYRPGGRLENYRGAPPLSDGAYALLPAVLKRAAEALARFDAARPAGRFHVAEKGPIITALTRVGLEGLAEEDAATRLADALVEARGRP
jgi:hypothetical protein